MARVTSKLQVTIPKVIADRYGIQPGDDLEWMEAGETIRVAKQKGDPAADAADATGARLLRFDAATQRQIRRQRSGPRSAGSGRDRGWKREDLYRRGRPR
jgi:AbrB family looped-hinge helix DNA binding protein